MFTRPRDFVLPGIEWIFSLLLLLCRYRCPREHVPLYFSLSHFVKFDVLSLPVASRLFQSYSQSELMSRRSFLWKKEVEEQKEKVGDMRRKNEALVYNILPPHVAVHFLGKRKKDEVRILDLLSLTILILIPLL